MSSELAEILRKLRGDESLRDAAKKLNISHQYLKILESGVDARSGDPVHVSATTIRKISEGYKISYDILLAAAGYLNSVGRVVEKPDQEGLLRIPIVGVVRAGAPLLAAENITGYRLIDSASVGSGDFFILNVTGDSMRDMHIIHGSRIVVRRQPYLENGEIGVVLVNGEDATVKKFRRVNSYAILSAANPD